ncbi:hypothetical protein [Methylobacterium sp. Leaf117]|uniref:hypothetical protein n=1 Tax=Methylobacterium sp. Leaf117 TaxID=1736260 RepID=UPI0006F9DA5E|nr:hypothetical protein [Methylobacterium sp. Leaf117]KQP82963.1 hypothetical protein ASF57_12650 [Methylobacterium sp. Leaf117]
MSHLSIVPPLAAQSNTLDLFTHPLAAGGFYPSYMVPCFPVVDGEEPCLNASIEVLIHQDQLPAFEAEANPIGEAAGLSHPVCDVATDHGGGTWRLIEVIGPRALILELMQVAQRHGCKRVLFPA